jgi:hypothetical protein
MVFGIHCSEATPTNYHGRLIGIVPVWSPGVCWKNVSRDDDLFPMEGVAPGKKDNHL